MQIRERLCASGLFQILRSGFEQIEDPRVPELIEISLADTLMSAFALFSLKDPSLLAFDKRRQTDDNLRTVYGIGQVPCDTQMRSTLDPVEPAALKPLYTDVFREAQRGKVLERFVFMNGCYLLSLDGSGYFASHKIHCESCMQKVNAQTGEVTYYHQILAGALVQPDLKEVIPLAPEPIIKQDGQTKNDCERNAAKRFFAQFRQDHPRLPVIITEDALSANAPHVEELVKYDLHFILGVKEGDHAYLFEQVQDAQQRHRVTEVTLRVEGITHHFRFINHIGLNQSHPDLRVNFVEYWETHPDGKVQHFSWITDFRVTRKNVFQIMRGGRARWKIENETFNTVKNQGYHFEHNFGHGEKNLSVVFALLMLLAFLVDQTQQLACHLFQAVLTKLGSRRELWQRMRSLFETLPVTTQPATGGRT
jgi:hypothetical protein